MAKLTASHIKFEYGTDGLPTGAVETIHFTRRDMLEVYADAMRTETGDPALERAVEYVGEDCVIMRWTYAR